MKSFQKEIEEDGAERGTEDQRITAQESATLTQWYRQCLSQPLEYSETMSLMKSNVADYFASLNLSLQKYYNLHFTDFPPEVNEDGQKVIKLGHILSPSISESGQILGFQLREQIVHQFMKQN